MGRKLEYLNQGRGGYVVYKDSEGEIQMYFEFGGGHCVAIIDVPSETKWTATTARPLEERQAILTFVAERAIRDQVPGGYYSLSDHAIEIFKDPVTWLSLFSLCEQGARYHISGHVNIESLK